MKRVRFTFKLKILIGFLVVALFFILLNLFWIATVAVPYAGYINMVEEQRDQIEPDRVNYIKEIDGYILEVKKPGYLDFDSFLSVHNKDFQTIEIDSETGEIIGSSGLSIYLYIWPDLWGNYEYGVFFDDEAEDVFEQIMITSDIVYLPKDPNNIEHNTVREQLLEDNYDVVSEMMQIAKDVWFVE